MTGLAKKRRGDTRTARLVALAVALAGLAAGRSRAGEAATPLDEALAARAPAIVRDLRARGYRNVGVLKFLARVGDGPLGDRTGLMNHALANRLEIALVLADDGEPPLGVIGDASRTAAALPGASHLSAEGRRALFAGRYPLAWGTERVVPDAFLTGEATLGGDLRRITVVVHAFDNRAGDVREVARLTVATDPPTLAEAGESFLLRGAFDEGRQGPPPPGEPVAVTAAARVREEKAPHPLLDPEAPVTLDVLYDGKPAPLTVRHGQALVPEPREGQSVAFEVAKRRDDATRYGVALFVNGENTLFRRRDSPAHAPKWVLGPGATRARVRGYQTTQGRAEAFRVLSDAESPTRALNYGDEAGRVSLFVFPEAPAGPDAPAGDDEQAAVIAAVSRGAYPDLGPGTRPLNPDALKLQLHSNPEQGLTRGLIEHGDALHSRVREVGCRFRGTPVMGATVRYYQR